MTNAVISPQTAKDRNRFFSGKEYLALGAFAGLLSLGGLAVRNMTDSDSYSESTKFGTLIDPEITGELSAQLFNPVEPRAQLIIADTRHDTTQP